MTAQAPVLNELAHAAARQLANTTAGIAMNRRVNLVDRENIVVSLDPTTVMEC
jgi:hypothetical protein